ncbi:hypothetical protein B5M09_008878 [Aphanomyces astaci]|uniref:Uncharacterized protein n=1 Tax=Aphanomyces astaci TaxID=112090 RepID=A0A3R7YF08_APHAT|nr:hypothetical protein B5M09_008878 [Aphanomyces astaci]
MTDGASMQGSSKSRSVGIEGAVKLLRKLVADLGQCSTGLLGVASALPRVPMTIAEELEQTKEALVCHAGLLIGKVQSQPVRLEAFNPVDNMSCGQCTFTSTHLGYELDESCWVRKGLGAATRAEFHSFFVPGVRQDIVSLVGPGAYGSSKNSQLSRHLVVRHSLQQCNGLKPDGHWVGALWAAKG